MQLSRLFAAGALVFLLTLPAAAPALSGTALQQLTHRLEQAPVVHAGFSQVKTLQALKQPLRSSGRLVFARDRGVLWLIEKPYQASYALTDESVSEIAADGSRRTRPAHEAPAWTQVGRVFRALFQGDLQALETYFAVSVNGDADHWQVSLEPRPELRRFLKGIVARGGQYLDLIEVEESQGDHTLIEFHDTQLDTPLTPAEAGLLQQ